MSAQSIRVIWAISGRFVMSLLKNKASLLSLILLPVIFTFMFGVLPSMGDNGRIPVAVVDEDHSRLSAALIQEMSNRQDVKVLTTAEDQATETLRNKTAGLVVTIPSHFGDDLLNQNATTIDFTPAPDQGGAVQSSLVVERNLQAGIQSWQIGGEVALKKAQAQPTDQNAMDIFLQGADAGDHIKPLVIADGKTVRDGLVRTSLTQGQQAVIGFSTMFIMFAVFGVTGSVLREKQTGTWSRLKASPASKASLMAGYSLGFFIIGWIQFAILYVVGRWLFGIDILMNGWTLLTVSLYILATCGLALCIVGVVKTVEQHMGIGSMVAVSTSMIGGAYWPIDVEPIWMQHVAWLVPQNWTIEAFRVISMGIPTLSTLLWPLAVLAGFAFVFFTAGLVQLRYT